LAQIGEFSFILVVLGVNLLILPPMARDLVVAGALLSILVNPLLFLALARVLGMEEASSEPVPAAPPQAPEKALPEEKPTSLSGHAVLVGYGRVGRRVSAALKLASIPLVVVEEEPSTVETSRQEGLETFSGHAGERSLLDRVNLAGARWLIAAIPDVYEAGHLIEEARAANPAIRVLARAHGAEEVEYLRNLGADLILMGEEEIAKGMIRDVLGQSEAEERAA
jgi:CPA2 family monovalent cation:H+ antiporter-2